PRADAPAPGPTSARRAPARPAPAAPPPVPRPPAPAEPLGRRRRAARPRPGHPPRRDPRASGGAPLARATGRFDLHTVESLRSCSTPSPPDSAPTGHGPCHVTTTGGGRPIGTLPTASPAPFRPAPENRVTRGQVLVPGGT